MSNQTQTQQTQKQYTQDFYSNLQFSYNYFNENLFNSELPQCLITCNRKNKTLGYYSPYRFTDTDNSVIDEIAINPDYLNTPIKEILSTLTHEMCHLWVNFKELNTGRRGFHNQAWADKMKSVGLQPIDIKSGENADTGFKMSHKIIESDVFDTVCDQLLEEIKFDLINVAVEKEKKERKKTKWNYVCPGCEEVVSGKQELELYCKKCEMDFEVEE